jgi:hypothetical protein
VVLTTTRDEGVAKIMGAVEAYNLATLGDEFIKEIIETRAFSLQKEEERPVILVNLVGDIVKRCRGSPLAATALGSVLRTKTSEEEWKAISSRSNICTEESGILPILKLSYNDLSPQMKQCFAFCAVFPKDYKIIVDKLIQLWIAHGFIQDQKEVSLETIGKRIFNELASRSFFVDVKQAKVRTDNTLGSYSKHTCQIHDLMHDVALSAMENECALALEKPSQIEWLPDSARHVLMSCEDAGSVLNDSLAKRSPAIQTLLCDCSMDSLQHLSKYRSLKALKFYTRRTPIPLKSKHLHQLRYLDLSGSDIKALPEDISILYNLQTLNVSGCEELLRLPRQMKYMTALRHLYTDDCPVMESMPGDLGKLVSLQTLTRFVAGPTTSECSDVGELQQLNLGGQLELNQLENATEKAAKAASIGKKKELRELKLKWTVGCEGDAKVLEALKPHAGLQGIEIQSYGGTTFPTWMAMLRNLVEMHISNCEKLQWLFSCASSFTFPNLKEFTLQNLECLERWCDVSSEEQGQEIIFPQLEKLSIVGCAKLTVLPEAALLGESYGTMARSAFPALKVLCLKALASFCKWEAAEGTERGHVIFPNLEELTIDSCPVLIGLPEAPFGGDYSMARSAFPALKVLCLKALASFCKWEAAEGTERGHAIFPNLEELTIDSCRVLTGLPEAPFGGDYSMARSTFPALKVLCLKALASFHKWEAAEGTERGHIIFPNLEELTIVLCPVLTGLPEAPFGGDYSMARSTFPALKFLKLQELDSFERMDAVEAPEGDEIMFPQLEKLYVVGCKKATTLSGQQKVCPKLITEANSPKLSVLQIEGSEEDMFMWVARHMTSLTSLDLWSSKDMELAAADNRFRFTQVVDAMEKGNHNDFPLTHLKLTELKSGGTELYAFFVQLQHLEINGCAALVYWPEKEFQSMVFLKSLVIKNCNELVGYAQSPTAEPSTTSESSIQLLPRLESLTIEYCESMVEVFRLPASLREMDFTRCDKLKSVFSRRLQQEQSAASILQGPSPIYSEVSSSPAVARAEHLPFPCLEEIKIFWCDSFTGVLYLPPSLKKILIYGCGGLRSVESQSGEFPSLEHLYITDCKTVSSLPDGPQAYSSLQRLSIENCPGLKRLPTCLQQRLSSLEYKELDARYEGMHVSVSTSIILSRISATNSDMLPYTNINTYKFSVTPFVTRA